MVLAGKEGCEEKRHPNHSERKNKIAKRWEAHGRDMSEVLIEEEGEDSGGRGDVK